MNTSEICKALGEAKFKEMVLELNTPTLKKILAEVGIPAVRSVLHLSSQKRNEAWATRLWQALAHTDVAAVVLYAWLGGCRNALLVEFLDNLGIPHQQGLTNDDFLNKAEESKLLQAAKTLLEKGEYKPQEVAIYLLFLDASNQSNKFESLHLKQYLTPQ